MRTVPDSLPLHSPLRRSRGGLLLAIAALLFPSACITVASVEPKTSPPSKIVTIRGSGFGAAPVAGDRVSYDGEAAEVVSWSETEIRARIPRRPDGTYALTVTRLGEISAPISHVVVTGDTLAVYDVRFIPNPACTLSGIVEATTNFPASAAFQVSRAGKSWIVPPSGVLTSSPGFRHRAAVLGLRPTVAHDLEVTVTGSSRQLVDRTSYTPGALPASFPPVQRLRAAPAETAPGYTLFPIHQGVVTIDSYIYALDSEGFVVWYAHPGLNMKLDDLEYLSSGRVAYISTGAIHEVDVLGQEVRTIGAFDLGVPAVHHMLTELPNGNLVSLFPNMRLVAGYPGNQTYEVVSDGVIEMTPDGQPVRQILLWDWLDPHRVLDWNEFSIPVWGYIYGNDARTLTGANGVAYDPADDTLVVSMRSQDMVVKISRATGAPRWVLGEEFAGSSGDDHWPFLRMVGNGLFPKHQHAPEVLADGHVMVYDNGNYRSPIEYSRAVEYAIDEPSGTVAEAWSWTDPEYQPPLFSYFTGDADRLPNGNVLVADSGLFSPPGYPLGSRWIRLAEVRGSDRAKLWEVAIQDPALANSFTGYDAKRIASLYPLEPLSDPGWH